MLAPVGEITVVEAPGAEPESDEGRALFAKLLDAPVDRLQFFPHSTPPGHDTERHVHTATVAAYLVSGEMEIATGPKYDRPIHVRAGDYLLIPEGLAHRESVLGDREVVFVVAHLRGFHTLSA